jgi:hypothetical protein
MLPWKAAQESGIAPTRVRTFPYKGAMWRALALCAVILGLYWVDHTYYAGFHVREASMMLREIMGSYR